MSKCRPTDDGYLTNEHYDDCEDAKCAGCWPCVPHTEGGRPQAHCTASKTCTNHIPETDQTCAKCLGKVRVNLRRIGELYRLVPAAVTAAARIDGEEVNLAAPTMGAHEWSDWKTLEKTRVEQETLAKLDALRQAAEAEEDAEIRAEMLADIPDDDTAVLAAWETVPEDDIQHPYAVLGRWQLLLEDDPRECYPVDAHHVSVNRATAYLDRNLDQLAQDDEQDFPLFRSEVGACLAHLENVFAVAKRDEKGAPCHLCPKPAPRLVLKRNETDLSGASDRWQCPDNRDHWWTDAEYRLRVGQDYRRHATKLTASDLHAQYAVKEGSVRGWAAKEAEDGEPLVRKRGRDHNGLTLYDVADVLAVKAGTRRARKRDAA